MKFEKIPHLDLFNFEDTEVEKSRYVLTSPRSLEACRRIGVKPIDLLYKDISVFEATHSNLSSNEIDDLFERAESNRKDKLRSARSERDKLIDEGWELEEVCDDEKDKKCKSKKRDFSDGVNKKKLGKTLTPTNNGMTKLGLKEKDAKILDLMLRRKAEENADAEFAMEQERNSRRRLERAQQVRDSKLGSIRRALESERLLMEQEQTTWQLEQAALTESDHVLKSRQIMQLDRAADRRVQIQKREMTASIAARQRELNLRHERANENLRMQEKETQKYNEELKAYSQEALFKAEQERLRRELREVQRCRAQNQQRRLQYEQRLKSAQEKLQNDTEELRHDAVDRHKAVNHNRSRLEKQRIRSASESRSDRQRREKEAADRRKLQEAEVEEYKQQLEEYRIQSMKRAEATQNARLALVAARSAVAETKRQAAARQAKAELTAAEQAWQTDTLALAEERERRAAHKLRDKEMKLQEARKCCRLAESLRDEVKRSADTFDKKVRQVDLVNQLGLGW